MSCWQRICDSRILAHAFHLRLPLPGTANTDTYNHCRDATVHALGLGGCRLSNSAALPCTVTTTWHKGKGGTIHWNLLNRVALHDALLSEQCTVQRHSGTGLGLKRLPHAWLGCTATCNAAERCITQWRSRTVAMCGCHLLCKSSSAVCCQNCVA